MPKTLDALVAKIDKLKAHSTTPGAIGFFSQEALRFCSIAGTLSASFDLGNKASIDQRYITHILTRSLLENFFTILYIFDDQNRTNERYDQLKHSFKIEYNKLINDLNSDSHWGLFLKTHAGSLEPLANINVGDKGLPNNHDMLMAVLNKFGDRLDYIYPTFRITSFDTHGKSLGRIFSDVFGKECHFPTLNIETIIEVISSEYINIITNYNLDA